MRRLSFAHVLVVLMLGSMVTFTPLVAAQTAPPSLPGITVLGSGRASAPAETATVVLMLGPAYYYEPKPVEPGAPSMTPEMTTEEAIAPVIDALIAAGVPEEDIRLLSNPYSGEYSPEGTMRSATIAFDLDAPTADGISTILDAAIPVAVEQGYFVNMVGTRYGVADCAPLERQARQSAIDDARAKAELQAELIGVGLGDVVASQDELYGSPMYGGEMPTASCADLDAPISITTMWNVLPFDPAIEPQVTIQAHVRLTFGIADGATPAP